MNNTAKGDRYELKVKRLLEMDGFDVEKVKKLKFQKRFDFFGCADLIALRKDMTMLVQVTSKANVSRARRKLGAFQNHKRSIIKVIYFYLPNGEFKSEVVQ